MAPYLLSCPCQWTPLPPNAWPSSAAMSLSLAGYLPMDQAQVLILSTAPPPPRGYSRVLDKTKGVRAVASCCLLASECHLLQDPPSKKQPLVSVHKPSPSSHSHVSGIQELCNYTGLLFDSSPSTDQQVHSSASSRSGTPLRMSPFSLMGSAVPVTWLGGGGEMLQPSPLV